MIAEVKSIVRYLSALPSYLRRPITLEDARRRLSEQMARRDAAFLGIVQRGIFDNPGSPYRRLLQHAGVEYGDIVRQVGRDGVEDTLAALHDAGVFVTIDEFKGRRPIVRPGLHLSVRPSDFDNPLLAHHYEGESTGSRGPGRRVLIDLDLLTHEAAYLHHYLSTFDLERRPVGLWHPVPPGAAGMKWALRLARLGRPPAQWFSPTPIAWNRGSWRFALFTSLTLSTAWLVRNPLPVPANAPVGDVTPVLGWLASMKRGGTPGVLACSPSSGVRICQAARERNVDIADTFFIFGGEPWTDSKAESIRGAGCHGVNHYSMVEVGNVGLACAEPAHLDDVHLLTDKLAVIQRHPSGETHGPAAGALVYTTLLPSCPKLMLNVESGDEGVLTVRPCGCFLGRLGFQHHLGNIRSYEKLTSEGMTFHGTELLRLVEEALPGRFGGTAIDYQLVETEEEGLSRISIVASPRLGPLDEAAVLATVFEVLGQAPGGRMMTDHWRQGQTLRVVRREPYVTSTAKVLPLRVRQAG